MRHTGLQEAQPHKAEAVAVTGNPVKPGLVSEVITLDDLAASLRLEHGEVAAALMKARDSLQEQARSQQQKEAQELSAAEAAAAIERAKPKVGDTIYANYCCCMILLPAVLHLGRRPDL